jgi:hypothetical protein
MMGENEQNYKNFHVNGSCKKNIIFKRRYKGVPLGYLSREEIFFFFSMYLHGSGLIWT